MSQETNTPPWELDLGEGVWGCPKPQDGACQDQEPHQSHSGTSKTTVKELGCLATGSPQ